MSDIIVPVHDKKPPSKRKRQLQNYRFAVERAKQRLRSERERRCFLEELSKRLYADVLIREAVVDELEEKVSKLEGMLKDRMTAREWEAYSPPTKAWPFADHKYRFMSHARKTQTARETFNHMVDRGETRCRRGRYHFPMHTLRLKDVDYNINHKMKKRFSA